LPPGRSDHWRKAVHTLVLTGLVAALSGCQSVQRRMTIRSNPPGALVLVDGREIGYTPASVDFTYYGTREITLVKDGYETLTTLQCYEKPWYQYPGVEFVSDNFLPVTVTNRHDITYGMRPAVAQAPGDLRNRGDSFRSRALMGR
jgi:hypothetical protein